MGSKQFLFAGCLLFIWQMILMHTLGCYVSTGLREAPRAGDTLFLGVSREISIWISRLGEDHPLQQQRARTARKAKEGRVSSLAWIAWDTSAPASRAFSLGHVPSALNLRILDVRFWLNPTSGSPGPPACRQHFVGLLSLQPPSEPIPHKTPFYRSTYSLPVLFLWKTLINIHLNWKLPQRSVSQTVTHIWIIWECY